MLKEGFNRQKNPTASRHQGAFNAGCTCSLMAMKAKNTL
jgi:hypothetical protein